MQVSLETINELERKLTVEIPAAKIESSFSKKLNELSKSVRLDGFRPGKVPVKVIKKRFGASVRGEVVEKAIQESFYEALSQEKIAPAGMPSIESVIDEEGRDIEFVALFEVYPEIELQGFEGISIEELESEVTDDDFETRLKELQEQAKEWSDVSRKAKKGDQVLIDYEGTLNGEAFQGGTASDSTLELGSGSMIPGFEDGLVGAKKDEEKSLDLTFPDEYHAEELKGQKVNFKVSVKAVKESVIPELNDELAEKMGVVEGGLEALKTQLRESMEKELDTAIKNSVKQQVMDALLKNNPIDVPKAVITQQINLMKQQMLSQFGGASNIDTSMFPDEMFADKAQENAALSLVLGKVIEVRKLTANREDIKAFVEDMAASYGEQSDEIIQYYMSDQQRTSEIEALVLEQKLIEQVIAEGTVTKKKVSFKEAMTPKAPEESDSEEK